MARTTSVPVEAMLEDPAVPVAVYQLRTAELGDSTYLVVCGDEAAVVDPQRDVERCTVALRELGVRLTAVLETHIHNDYLTGGPELARAHGAAYVVPDDAGYVGEHRAAREGDEFAVGTVTLRPLFTPGHTPHHLSYEIVAGGQAVAVLSGGCVLVGAMGRTDLVSPELTEPLAHAQYHSARRIGALPDPTTVGPTHGAGSFCTSSAAAGETWTTVGRERGRNPAFLAAGEEDFVRRQLSGLSPHPAYYAEMGPINRAGSRPWPARPLEVLQAGTVRDRMRRGVSVVDTRERHEFAAGHVPGSVNIELDGSFSAYLGWLFPFGTRFLLISTTPEEVDEASTQAFRIGIDTIDGRLANGIDGWRDAGLELAAYPSIGMGDLGEDVVGSPDTRVLDVRQDAEWLAGHVPGADHVPIQDVPERARELAGDARTTYVHCASGFRSAMAASLLDAAGAAVVHVDGLFETWARAGHPVERG